MKRRTLRLVSFIFMSLVMFVTPLGVSFIPVANKKAQETQTVNTRTIETREQEVDFQSILNSYEDAVLSTEGSVTYFEGTKKLDASILSEIDNLSESDVGELQAISVRYYYSFDAETGIVTLSAETKNEQGIIIEIEEIYGAAFINEDGNIDALLDVDGDYILLSELQEAGMIENCGWFKKLFKKVATKIAVAVVAVIVVSAATAAIVATAGAGLGAVIAAGAIAGSVTGMVGGGLISYSEYGKLDWRWIAGGAVIGGVIGAVVGWGVGGAVMKTTTAQTNRLIKAAKNGKLDFSNSIKNKSYFVKGNNDYREYYEEVNLISREIMKTKNPAVESSTKFLKWSVEGVKTTTTKGGVVKTTKGVWELVVDPVKEVIVHFLFRT